MLTPPDGAEHRFEPGLPAALASLPERQRVAVVLVHGFGYTLREVADLTGIKTATVQNHLDELSTQIAQSVDRGARCPRLTYGSSRIGQPQNITTPAPIVETLGGKS